MLGSKIGSVSKLSQRFINLTFDSIWCPCAMAVFSEKKNSLHLICRPLPLGHLTGYSLVPKDVKFGGFSSKVVPE